MDHGDLEHGEDNDKHTRVNKDQNVDDKHNGKIEPRKENKPNDGNKDLKTGDKHYDVNEELINDDNRQENEDIKLLDENEETNCHEHGEEKKIALNTQS